MIIKPTMATKMPTDTLMMVLVTLSAISSGQFHGKMDIRKRLRAARI
jgi:hypothetical protein